MRVYIPSTHRYGSALFKAGPLYYTSPERRATTLYVVPEGQGPQYRDGLFKAGYGEVGVLEVPAEVKGIAGTRYWIGALSLKRDEGKFLMMDDDIKIYVRRSPDAFNLVYATPEQTEEMLKAVEAKLDTHGHVAVSAREGNNRFGVGGPDLCVENTRTLRCLAYRTADFLACEHGRVEVQEDFDVNLQLLGKGIPNANLVWWAQGQMKTNAPGGCSTYRTHEVQDRAARTLAELHPGCVTLRQKQNKTDAGGFGTRTEVTIGWQKKYKQGLAALAQKNKEAA